MQRTQAVNEVTGNGMAVFSKWIIGGVSGLWISISPATQALLVFMVIDYVTGLLCAIMTGTLCSREGFRGLARKTLTLLLVGTASYAAKALHAGVDLGSVVAMGFVANELVSIVENCARAGVPIPDPLLSIVLKAKRAAGPTRSATQIEQEIAAAEKEAEGK